MRILKEMLNTLKSIDGTLKRIKQSILGEKQREMKEIVSHVMIGGSGRISHSEEVKDALYQQIETLAEESKKTSDTETKIRIAGEIDRIAETIIRIDAD